jgi:hydroxylysine kinase
VKHPTEIFLSLAAPATRIPVDEAQRLALRHYGLKGEVKRLDTEKDDTFRVETADGRKHLLKVANAAERPEEISFQIKLLGHVARANPALPVPRVIPDGLGAERFSYKTDAGEHRQVHLLSYLEGSPLSEVEATARQREQVGEALALLRLAAADFADPVDAREIAWDVKHLPRLAPLLREIEEAADRDLLEQGLQRFSSIAGRLSSCRTQVLHNDFSKSNIIVQQADPGFVTGIIDFGDAVRTAIAIDVSTALVNQLPRVEAGDFFADGHDLLRGYLRIADLTDEELSLVPHLVMGRVVGRTLLTYWRGRLFPHNSPYIMRNTAQGWHQLRWFMDRSMDAISDDFISTARHQGAGQ